MKYFKFKIIGLVCLVLIGAVLFYPPSSSLARLIRGGTSFWADKVGRVVEENNIRRIFVDLDDTLFKPKGFIGSDAWVRKRVGEVGYERAHREFARHEERMLKSGFFELTESEVASKLSEFKSQGIEIIGITSRSYFEQERTQKILESLGIDIDIIFAGSDTNKIYQIGQYIRSQGNISSESNNNIDKGAFVCLYGFLLVVFKTWLGVLLLHFSWCSHQQ